MSLCRFLTKGFGILGAVVCLSAIDSGRASHAAELGATDEPIVFAMLEWTGQNVTSLVAGHILEEMGYETEYVTAGTYPHFTALAEGQIHASLENWLSNVGEAYPKLLEAGQIEELGELGLETRESWVYPSYVAEKWCPGLPNWEALTEPDCVEALATPETFPKGRILAYPAEWGNRSEMIIAQNDLPLVAVPAGQEGVLIAELQAAVAAEKPLVMMFWAPHWVLANIDVGWVEMPPCPSEDPGECLIAPKVVKTVWPGMSEKWPAAYEFLQSYQMYADDQEEIMYRVDKLGEDPNEVTRDWVANNRSTWEAWMPVTN